MSNKHDKNNSLRDARRAKSKSKRDAAYSSFGLTPQKRIIPEKPTKQSKFRDEDY